MSEKKKNVNVNPRPEGGWEVKRDKADRASSTHETKKEAMTRGREIARKDGVELVEKGKDGRIIDKDSHGRDPFPPRDKNR